MKTFLAVLLAAIFLTIPAQAALLGAPHMPESDQRFDVLEAGRLSSGPGTEQALYGSAIRTAKVTYDFAVKGGAVGLIPLGVYLPANAVIVKSFYEIATQFTGSGSLVGFQCEDTNNILNPISLTSYASGVKRSAIQNGDASLMTGSIAADCQINAVVQTAAVTAGKLYLYVQYVIGL